MAGRPDDSLPVSARVRLARATASGVRTSLLPVHGAVGIESVGLEPVGEVMGCFAQNLGWMRSGWGVGFGLSVDFGPYERAVSSGYHHALSRLAAEARALGADGVVDVRLTADHLESGVREYVALGTAVGARSSQRPAALFTTELPGQDVAKLMHSGWVPVRIALGIAVSGRYLDQRSRWQMSLGAGNTEVDAHTRLITDVRAQARTNFREHAAEEMADGALVSDMSLYTWQQEINEQRVLLCAESKLLGTTVARFARQKSARPSSLTIMPLK